jgi:phage protein U
MYYQLGSTIFEGLFGPSEMERTTESKYAEVELVNGKPDLQLTGLALDTISINIRLHEFFCNPGLRYSELETYRKNGEILPFIDGNGGILGNFVIEKIKQNILQTDPHGQVILCECELSLKEHVDPNRSLAKANNAKRDAFALSATSLTLIKIGPPANPAADIFKSIGPVTDNIRVLDSSIKQASTNADLADKYMDQALKTADSIKKDVDKLQDKITKYTDSIANANQMAVAISNMGNNLITLGERLAAGDLPNSLAGSTVLTGSLKTLLTTARPLQKLLILR